MLEWWGASGEKKEEGAQMLMAIMDPRETHVDVGVTLDDFSYAVERNINGGGRHDSTMEGKSERYKSDIG